MIEWRNSAVTTLASAVLAATAALAFSSAATAAWEPTKDDFIAVSTTACFALSSTWNHGT